MWLPREARANPRDCSFWTVWPRLALLAHGDATGLTYLDRKPLLYKWLHGCGFEAYILHPVMLFYTSQRPVTGQHFGEIHPLSKT